MTWIAGKSILAQVTPAVLHWARIDAGHATSEAVIRRLPKRARISADQLRAWETGVSVPRMTQAKALAKLYHRPLTVFFLPVPLDYTIFETEYRRLSGVKLSQESPELRIALRGLMQRRKDALRLFGELEETPPPFDLTIHLDEQQADLAKRIRLCSESSRNDSKLGRINTLHGQDGATRLKRLAC